MHGSLSKAWGDWLGTFDWDWWCTLTFKEPYSPDAADRAFQRWVVQLPAADPAAGGVGYFVGHEVGSLGRLHLHALLGGLAPGARRDLAWRSWFDRHGRAQILPYDPGRGAAEYVSKYVTKDLARYDIRPYSSSNRTFPE